MFNQFNCTIPQANRTPVPLKSSVPVCKINYATSEQIKSKFKDYLEHKIKIISDNKEHPGKLSAKAEENSIEYKEWKSKTDFKARQNI